MSAPRIALSHPQQRMDRMDGLPKLPRILVLAEEIRTIKDRHREDYYWLGGPTSDPQEQARRTARYSADECRLDAISRFLGQLERAQRVSTADYCLMLEDQDWSCAICRVELGPDVPPMVDHNHATGKVRGLLCGSCNTGLGLLKDSPDVIEGALAYLEERGYYGSCEEEG